MIQSNCCDKNEAILALFFQRFVMIERIGQSKDSFAENSIRSIDRNRAWSDQHFEPVVLLSGTVFK